ncbi:MAG TPA: dihydroorotate dehydrogenase electron transfer subunit [Peptococcaceae bacterium]|nr:dihydroorotate dehydrogenase electron transfer subunit [Peptococcaceae bacterium]
MPEVLAEKVESMEELARGVFRMRIKSGYIAEEARPGQFVNIKCGDGMEVILRRPISICSVDRDKGTFDVVFQVRGTGTALLAQKRAGDMVDFIGPLGKAFHMPENPGRIAVVGGGIGIFPLYFLLKELKGVSGDIFTGDAFLGFRDSASAIMLDDFRQLSGNVFISTDDGSMGFKGTIVQLFGEKAAANGYDLVYACGPAPMMKKVIELADRNGIKCQVSLEQRMGCGIGACLVCACKTKKEDGWEYKHVCKDGPVFWSGEIILED